MSSAKVLKVDGNKFKRELEKRGLEPIEVSRTLGYSDDYINKIIRKEQISVPSMNALEWKYDIRYEEYECTPEPEVQVPAPVQQTIVQQVDFPEDSIVNLTMDDLQNLLYRAVYAAVSHAWNQPYKGESK